MIDRPPDNPPERATFDTTKVPAEAWIRVLTGDLPCAKCRYNLRGLSILAVCPECGTPVRGTILATVDPHARELSPIYWPIPTAVSLILWSLCCLGAALAVLLLRSEELIRALGGPNFALAPEWRSVPALLLALAGVFAVAFVRPHAKITVFHSLAAALACLAHFPLAYLMWQVHAVIDAQGGPPFTSLDPRLGPIRSMFRLGCAACMAVLILGIRPNGRLLVSRSLLMRTGRVDRQTLLVILAAVGLAAMGDVLRLGAPGVQTDQSDILAGLGAAIIAVGSFLILLGIFGVVIDILRLRHSIVAPPLHLDTIAPIEPARQAPPVVPPPIPSPAPSPPAKGAQP